MKSNVGIGIPVIIGIAVCGGAFWFMAMESSQRQGLREAHLNIEQAREALRQYNAQLVHIEHSVAESAAVAEQYQLSSLSEEGQDAFQESFRTNWQLFEPTDWMDKPRVVKNPPAGSVSSQVQGAQRELKDILSANKELLQDAMAAVNDSLSAEPTAEANRVKAAVEYQQGQRAHAEASVKRVESSNLLRGLAQFVQAATGSTAAQDLVQASNIDARIAELEDSLRDVNDRIAEEEAELAELNRQIRSLESQLTDAEYAAAEARAELDQLKADGRDMTDPKGAEKFAEKVKQASQAYRDATRRLQAIKRGDLKDAELIPGGDPLGSDYVSDSGELDYDYGLTHYNELKAVADGKLELRVTERENLRTSIAKLRELRDEYASLEAQAAQQQREAEAGFSGLFAEWKQVDEEAARFEADALKKFSAAAKSAKSAGILASSAVSEAARMTIPPEAQGSSASYMFGRAKWFPGFVAVQEADARMGMAWVYADQVEAYRDAHTVLDRASDVMSVEVDAAMYLNKMQDAQTEGSEAVEAALGVLKKAHSATDQNWAISAQAASAGYLWVLLGQKSDLGETIRAYEVALDGREDEAYAHRFVARMRFLQNQ